jgi:hypothetical protein
MEVFAKNQGWERRGRRVWNQLLRNPKDFESLILMTYGSLLVRKDQQYPPGT